ncbi:glycosyltransferase family 1 protein [bacterium]|nr:MAG: glycosyltransferase family 1 protein [bacterium]
MILGIDASQANRKNRSGTEWYAYFLIREFSKLLANRPDILVRLYIRPPARADLLENLPPNFQISALRWPLKYFWVQARLSWELFMNPPDVLLCPAHTIPLHHPARTFTTLHDIGFEDFPELYDPISRFYHRWSARFAVKNAYHLFTISQFSKYRIIEKYHCKESRISAVYLGYNETRFKVLPKDLVEPVVERYGLRFKEYFLFVGRLEPKKNIMGTVRAYEASGCTKPLVFVGKKIAVLDVEEYLAERPNLASRVKFLGYVAEEDKSALFAGAEIFVFPTFYEGFGLPIIEAQAVGTPVVTSSTASNSEVAGKGALLVDPNNSQQIADALTRFSKDPGLREEKVREGLENVKRFSWAITARETLKLMDI